MDDGQERDSKTMNPVDEVAHRDMQPDFVSDKKENAADNLKKAEDATVNDGRVKEGDSKKSESGLDEARQKESEPENTNLFRGEGKEENGGKGRGILLKKAPILSIIITVFGLGGLMGGAQLLQPFSFVAQIQETFNSMHISANKRSEAFFRFQMSSGRTKSPYNAFGSDFKISEKQQTQLKQQGIEYIEEGNKKMLRFTGDDGKVYNVTADNFKDMYKNNPDFFAKYNAGSMTWRGQIANWFGSTTSRFLSNNKLTRNLFKNYKQELETEGGNKRKAIFSLMKKQAGMADGNATSRKAGVDVQDYEVKDEETGEIIKKGGKNNDPGVENFTTKIDVKTQAEINAKIQAVAAKFETPQKISAVGVFATNTVCAVVDFLAAVNVMVQAEQALQIITLTTSYFEAFDKTKAGDGEESPINELANMLNEKRSGKYTVMSSSGDGTEEITTDPKSAMEANAVVALYSDGRVKVDPSDPSVQSLNFSKYTNSLMGKVMNMGKSFEAFKSCAVARLVSSVVSAGVNIAEIVSCATGIVTAAVTVGATLAACAPLLGDFVGQIGLSAAVGTAISKAVEIASPIVVSMLTRDLITDAIGENLGNILVSGGNMYLGNTHKYNGGSLATIDKYKEFAVAQQQVIADNARYERESLSPFDLTSKYTFMGTIMASVMGFSRSNSLMGTIMDSSKVISSSLVALNTPIAQAYDISDILPVSMEEYAKTCPNLASIGAVGDAFCNPYLITDMETISYDPNSDVIMPLAEDNNFLDEPTSDGNVQLNPNGALAKHCVLCNELLNGYGTTNQNAVNELKSFMDVRSEKLGGTLNSAINGAIGGSAIGDPIDIAQNGQVLLNAEYINSRACVAGNDEPDKTAVGGSPSWEVAKVYQRFTEDQSLAESSGLIEKSAVTAFLDDYYEKNPLDNSYEGLLARYSGLDKESVIDILDVLEYEDYIANYHPEERYWFGEPKMEMEEERLMFDDGNDLAVTHVILLNQISYADVRNRTWTV